MLPAPCLRPWNEPKHSTVSVVRQALPGECVAPICRYRHLRSRGKAHHAGGGQAGECQSSGRERSANARVCVLDAAG